MAYTVVLNARQQAKAAERAESIALKAKELIRVYVWLDPAQQPNGRYLNLTRISFVGSWSGETTINGLLVVYRDGGSRMLGLNIRLGAGEEKTYLPSELGIPGLDNYDAFRRAVKYIQAHTSLGNDFVNLWGRPDRPAIYIVTTTNTGTTTTTTTPPTTTTTTSTTTPPTTTTTTTPPPTTTTTTPPPTVTTTVTVTETQYVYTRCTNVDWRYTTVTIWYTSTVYAGAVTTSTQWVTSTAWVTSTIPTTVTSTVTITSTYTVTERQEVRTTVTSWITVTYWTTLTSTRTVWTTIYTTTYTIVRYGGMGLAYDTNENSECGIRTVTITTSNPHNVYNVGNTMFTEPALMFLTMVAAPFLYRRRETMMIIKLIYSPQVWVMIVLLYILLSPVQLLPTALAQVTTTVTRTTTVTHTICTTTVTVVSTSTLTQYQTSTTTITTTGTVTTTMTSTTTRTSTQTQTYTETTTITRMVPTTTTITTTYTQTNTQTSTVTSTRWTTVTITSTASHAAYTYRCIALCAHFVWDYCTCPLDFPG
jgi:hypothetical protein